MSDFPDRDAKSRPGRPRDPNALRRMGSQLRLVLAPDAHEAAKRAATARGLSLTAHIVDLLRRWQRRHP